MALSAVSAPRVEPSRATRLVPRLLIGIGVLHLVAAPFAQSGFHDLVAAGVFDAVKDDPARESAAWYVVSGVSLLAVGDLAHSSVTRTGRLPDRLGVWVLAAGAVVTATLPLSPGWLVTGTGALAAFAARTPRQARRTP